MTIDQDEHARRTINLGSAGDKPVVVHCEEGSHVIVNIDVKNYYYSYPEWLDRQTMIELLREVRG